MSGFKDYAEIQDAFWRFRIDDDRVTCNTCRHWVRKSARIKLPVRPAGENHTRGVREVIGHREFCAKGQGGHPTLKRRCWHWRAK